MTPPSFKGTPLCRGLAEAVELLRGVADLDQADLARKVGWKLGVVQAIEQGEYEWTLADVEELAAIFKIKPYQLLAVAEMFARSKQFAPPWLGGEG